MSRLILFNKPYGVICQFRSKQSSLTLADFIDIPEFYPAGRLDKDSEGLVLLTDDGKLQARIAEPRFKLPKTYWVQVEGEMNSEAFTRLTRGVTLKDGKTRPVRVHHLTTVPLRPRNPPVRIRATIPTSWIELTISEGKNRQIRRMTAAIGYPTLRLFRCRVGPWQVEDLEAGEFRELDVNLPQRQFR